MTEVQAIEQIVWDELLSDVSDVQLEDHHLPYLLKLPSSPSRTMTQKRVRSMPLSQEWRVECPLPKHQKVDNWTEEHSSRLRDAMKEIKQQTKGIELDQMDWARISMHVRRPEGECKRQWELLDGARVRTTLPDYFAPKRKRPRVIRPVAFPMDCLDTTTCRTDDDAASILFHDETETDTWWSYDDNNDTNDNDDTNENSSPPNVMDGVDLYCYESAKRACFDKKCVRWYGLPENPPEWKRGPRQTVPRVWQPCRYVNTSSVRVSADKVFQPVLSTEMCTHSLPPGYFWT